MSFISEQLLTININLKPDEMKTDIDNLIKQKLKEKIECKCSENGYILKDSIIIIKRSLGKIQTFNQKSIITFIITYKAKVISPIKGLSLDVYINNINKMGVIAFIKLGIKENETFDDSPLIIILPKEYFNENTQSFEDLKINQKINITVVGSRIKYNSDKIQVVGKPTE
jgi:DNA-directed RNA polymerase subunit E'/Rpb7